MPYTIKHDLGPAVGDAAFAYGTSQRLWAEDERNYRRYMDDVNLQFRNDQFDFEKDKFYEQLQSQKEQAQLQREYGLQVQNMQSQGYLDYVRLQGENQRALAEQQIRMKLESGEYEYTFAQKKELQRLANARMAIMNSPRYSPEEKQMLLDQVDAKEYGIRGNPVRKLPVESRWPKGQQEGDIWVDERTGLVFSRDMDGNVRKHMDPPGAKEYEPFLKLAVEMLSGGEMGDSSNVNINKVIEYAQKMMSMSGVDQKQSAAQQGIWGMVSSDGDIDAQKIRDLAQKIMENAGLEYTPTETPTATPLAPISETPTETPTATPPAPMPTQYQPEKAKEQNQYLKQIEDQFQAGFKKLPDNVKKQYDAMFDRLIEKGIKAQEEGDTRTLADVVRQAVRLRDDVIRMGQPKAPGNFSTKMSALKF